jgi:ABC-type branched-subunit amino acid transport system substrate-binding protein
MAPAPPKVSGVRVALLLPLTGAQSELAGAMLNAAQMALFDFADQRMELLIHDTLGTPEGAAEAAALAIGDGASVILGPLLADSVRAVTPAARAANVTVLAFSSDRSVAGGGIFTMGFLPEAEVHRVVAFARSRGLRRFAALAPDNDYGAKVVAALERAAVGAVVSRVQFYDPGASDFSAAVRQLADYDARRGALVSQRSQLKARDDEIARRALRRLEKLQTVGDLPFDALLVADGGKRLQAIAALLPFFDVDPAKIKMLGTGRWEVAGLGAEPALVGGWFAAPPPAARSGFEARYRQTYGKPPHRLTTLAYDATALAAVLAQGEGGADFSAAALTSARGFGGQDGIFRLLANGVTERGLAVLQVGIREFKVISEAQETFEPALN